MKKVLWTTFFWLIVLVGFLGYMKWFDDGKVTQFVVDNFINQSEVVIKGERLDDDVLSKKIIELSEKIDQLAEKKQEQENQTTDNNVEEKLEEKLEEKKIETNKSNEDKNTEMEEETIEEEIMDKKTEETEKKVEKKVDVSNLSKEELEEVKELLVKLGETK